MKAADLSDDDRLDAVQGGLAKAGAFASTAGRLLVWSAACRALRLGKKPAAMFVGILNHAEPAKLIEQADEDAATARMKAFNARGRPPPNGYANGVADRTKPPPEPDDE